MTRRRRALARALLLLAAAPPAGGQEPRGDAGPAARVDAIFSRYDSRASPGCAVGVVKDGDLVLSRAYGMADLEHGVPLSPGSRFQLASVSKQFTAAAVLLAAERGDLSLDDDVRRYVPELPDYGAAITLRHLLHHTGGVRDYATLWRLAGESPADAHSAEETLALLARQRALDFPPGTDYGYSNSGYFLLALTVERATGLSLRAFAERHLFAPLGMGDTRFADDASELVTGRAVGHVRRGGSAFGRFSGNNEVVGARGVISSVPDLARWEAAFHDRTLGNEVVRRMLEPGRLAGGEALPYGAGLVVGEFDGLTTVSHGGEGDGSGAFLLRFPEMRMSVICLCNLAGSGAAGLAWQTATAWLFGPYREETDRLRTPSPPPRFVDLSGASLRRWTGAYRDPETRAVWSVSEVDGDLIVSTGGGRSRLRPVGPATFRGTAPGPTIVAEFEGPRMRFRVEGRPPSVFSRVEPVTAHEVLLEEYAGEYYSQELLVSWHLEVRDGALRLADAGAPPDPFLPTVRDEFALGAELRIGFERDEAGRIVAMSAHTDRVRDLRFERR